MAIAINWLSSLDPMTYEKARGRDGWYHFSGFFLTSVELVRDPDFCERALASFMAKLGKEECERRRGIYLRAQKAKGRCSDFWDWIHEKVEQEVKFQKGTGLKLEHEKRYTLAMGEYINGYVALMKVSPECLTDKVPADIRKLYADSLADIKAWEDIQENGPFQFRTEDSAAEMQGMLGALLGKKIP